MINIRIDSIAIILNFFNVMFIMVKIKALKI